MEAQIEETKMSKYMTTTLEDFAILLYCNSYDVWNHRWKSEASTNSNSSGEVDDMSTLSGATSKASFKYTGDQKGAKNTEVGIVKDWNYTIACWIWWIFSRENLAALLKRIC